MDSLTQAALGATVGHTLLGKHIGRAAPLVGAILGTLPDLDVLISFGGQIEDFTYHRSFSHSLLVQLALAPILTWLIVCMYPRYRAIQNRWFLAILAIFWTHSLLDACTVYGTQLLWPITEFPYGISSVFIIDPLYTLPLLIGLFLAFRQGWTPRTARVASASALAFSTLYLCWGFIAKDIVEEKVSHAWAIQNSQDNSPSILSTPLPLNSLLWRVVIDEGDRYSIAHVGLWENPDKFEFKQYLKGTELLKNLNDQWDVQRLIWFTKGFYRAQVRDNQIVISDLRMGVEGSYAFNFAIAEQIGEHEFQAIKAQRVDDSIDWTRFALLWDRFWDADISLHPSTELPTPSPIQQSNKYQKQG